jgi:hypothetical protein
MSRWTLYRERGQRKWKVLLLLTLSGAIRPADVELRYFGKRTTDAHQCEPSLAADPKPRAGTSIWSMGLKQLLRAYPKRPDQRMLQ